MTPKYMMKTGDPEAVSNEVLEFLGVDKAETKEASAKANPCGLSTEPVYIATTHAMKRSQPLDARTWRIGSDDTDVYGHGRGNGDGQDNGHGHGNGDGNSNGDGNNSGQILSWRAG